MSDPGQKPLATTCSEIYHVIDTDFQNKYVHQSEEFYNSQIVETILKVTLVNIICKRDKQTKTPILIPTLSTRHTYHVNKQYQQPQKDQMVHHETSSHTFSSEEFVS